MGAVMKLLTCAVMAVSMIAGAASASDWRLISVGRTGATGVDISTVSRSGDKAVAWTAIFLPLTVSEMDYALIRQEYECGAKTSRFLSVISYDEHGQVQARSDEPRAAISIAPDSNEMLMLKAVCFNEFLQDDPVGWTSAMALLQDYRTTPPQ